jgi:hypothetical protein
MKVLSPAPRWPLYERRCRDWTAALKQLRGEFRRDRSGESYLQLMAMMSAVTGAWVLWKTAIDPHPVYQHSPWNWLAPASGAVLLGMGVVLGRNELGTRYRFDQNEVCEISSRGHIRWREPLVTLQTVTFPWRARFAPQMLTLHWTTHCRTIELFPSIDAAVRDFRVCQPMTSSEPVERPWKCKRCHESNPETFEVCWQCGTAASQHQ